MLALGNKNWKIVSRCAIVTAVMQPDISIPTQSQPTKPDIPAPQASDKKSGEGWKNIVFTVIILVGAPLFALALTAFVFQSYRVDGISMETTLQNNDRLIIWKLPETIARIKHTTHMPNRGDIIVFTKEDMPDANGKNKQLIKRVIGLPGDRVVVKDNVITVYNNEHPNGFNPDKNQSFTAGIAPITSGDVDTVVEKGEVFVCGDNRPHSLDSRFFGAIPVSDIVGKLSYRIAPANQLKHF